MTNPTRFTNRLVNETSPYLLQHAHNPVDWYPWGPEALERAKREDKPIFLSIGYSACHWCHVMEHESFEDPDTAEVMNEYFVNIKVDREERPDLDHIYMTAVQLMTRHGGWPMSVFLTPELQPFYGGTYFPPQPRHGMPSFKQVLVGVADAWRNRRGELTRSAEQLVGVITQMNEVVSTGRKPSLNLVDDAVRLLSRSFDPAHGGFGGAPKFPHPMELKLCLRHWKRTGSGESLEMVTVTLDHMARGGIYDHLGGGFHRYSTDERWLVPHFEKMLYDNALLAQVYLEVYQATHNSEYARVARETLDYVLREMTAPEGGFYSTQDADSEGVEGKFFVWSPAELTEVLGPHAAQFSYVYDVSDAGNWEEHNILNRPKTPEQCARLLQVDSSELERSLAECRQKLFAARARRVPPGRDDKVLVSWNGLMIDAMARGYQVLGDERYLQAARRAADFILTKMRHAADAGTAHHSLPARRDSEALTTHLLHAFKDGRARFNAYLDDYANLIDSLVSLYEATFEPHWLRAALSLAEIMIDQFWDESGGSFFHTARNHESLVARVRDAHDSATPSGNAMAVTALLRLGRLATRPDLTDKAERTLQSFAHVMGETPMTTSQMLVALEFMLARPLEIVIVPGAGDDTDWTAAALRLIRGEFLPNKVVAARPVAAAGEVAATSSGTAPPEGSDLERLVPLLADKRAINDRTTVYLCEDYTCGPPIGGLEGLREALKSR